MIGYLTAIKKANITTNYNNNLEYSLLKTTNHISTRRQVQDLPKVKAFLESIYRNSKKSKESYHFRC
jgi:hypothetical protein